MGFRRTKPFRLILFFIWIGLGITDPMNAQEELSRSYFFYQQPEFPRDCGEVLSHCSPNNDNNDGTYWIKPDGYPTPFEVFCENMESSILGPWLIVERRFDGSIDFNRTWEEYQRGFGFLATEFWLGNDKLSYLTNQKRFELQIDMVNSEGSSFSITYDSFLISDEWSGYSLSSLGSFNGKVESFVTFCPKNMEFGDCTCQTTCGDPLKRNGCNDHNCIGGTGCFCPDGFYLKGSDCVPGEECACFVLGKGVLPNGGTYLNADCSSYCTCNNDLLTCEDYKCGVNATCKERNNEGMCYCEVGFEGNGQTCTRIHDCLDRYNAGNTMDGVYTIQPAGWEGPSFEVYCDMTTDNGGWTVFQSRRDGSTNFYRNWSSYKSGFGNLSREFWLGNDKLHAITNQKDYMLRTDLTDSNETNYFASYSLFRIGDETDNYLVTNLGNFSGTTSSDRIGQLLNIPFSTYDNDNEQSSFNCAEKHRGGWWYGFPDEKNYYSYYDCYRWLVGSYYYWCSATNLNGDYNGGQGVNIFWTNLGDSYEIHCNITMTEMKIRPA